MIILNIPLSLIFHVSGFRAEVLYLGQENPFPIVVLNMQTETEAAIAVPYKNQLPTKPIVIPTARNDFCLLQIIPSLISPRLRDQGGGLASWTGDPLPLLNQLQQFLARSFLVELGNSHNFLKKEENPKVGFWPAVLKMDL